MGKKGEPLFSMEALKAPIRVRASVAFYTDETEEEPRIGHWFAHFRRTSTEETEAMREQALAQQEKLHAIQSQYPPGALIKNMSPEDQEAFAEAQAKIEEMQNLPFQDLVSWEVRNGSGLMPVDAEHKQVLLSMPEMKVSIRAAWRKAQQMRVEEAEKN